MDDPRAPKHYGIDPESIFAMSESLASLALFFARGLQSAEPFAVRFAALNEAVKIFDFQESGSPAPGAMILSGFIVAPSDGYLDLFAAIVRDGYADAGAVDHGWPILVLRGDSALPTIAEVGEASSLPGGGRG